MNKIKVCNIIPGLRSGGIESFLYNVFSNGNWDDFDLTIITHGEVYDDVKNKFDKLNIKIYSVTPKNINIYKNFCEINNILRNGDFDIIHSHMSNNSIFPLFLSMINGIKIRIMHIHEKPKKNLKLKITNILSLLLATNICSCSMESLHYFLGNNKRYINCKIFYNYIDSSKYLFNKEERYILRKNLKISDDDFIIGLFGRFVQEKNHKFIIDVIEKINDSCIKLLLIGDGKLKKDIQNYIDNKKLSDKVILLDFQNNIESYYSAIDLFVLPSLTEGFGIVLAEAQISGLHCLASNYVPKETEIVKNSCSYLVLDQNLWKNEILNNKKKYGCKRNVNKTEYEIIDINYNSDKIQEYYKGLIRHE